MTDAFGWLALLFTAVCGALGLLLLLARTPKGGPVRRTLVAGLRRITGRPDLGGLEWWHIALAAAIVYGAVATFDVVSGAYSCPGGGRESDIMGFLNSGRALLAGTNPFTVGDCGSTIAEPYGLSSVVISAIGSPGGVSGVAFVWGVVAVALVPLTWAVAGPDRRYLTLFVAVSPLYLPLVTGQIDGASNALVPVTVLVGLVLMARRETVAAVVGGFLATGRFPAIFPLLSSFGSARRRYLGAGLAIASFGAVTLATYAVYRSEFSSVTFVSQIGRRSFSLNLQGVLQYLGLLPAGDLVPAVQALLTVAVVVVAFFRVQPGLRAAAFTLTGVALLTQYLSFNFLVCLLPVALVNARARWWFWAAGIVGAVNYDLAWGQWANVNGVFWPTELLDVVLTLLLLGMLIDIARASDPAQPAARPAADRQ